MNRSLARLMLLLAFALAGSCSDGGTEVRVDVVPSPALAAVSGALNVRVVRDAYGKREDVHPWETHLWKNGRFTISVTPRDDAREAFAIEVQALQGTSPTPIGWARLITEFVSGKRRHHQLAIEERCPPSVICGELQTCREGICEDAYLHPDLLGHDSEDAPAKGGVRDAGLPSGDAAAPLPASDGAVAAPPVVDDGALPSQLGDASVPTTPVVPARDAAIDWGARLADSGFLVRDAGRPDSGGIQVSRCFTRDVLETEEELEAGEVTRMRNAVGFCFANDTESCFDLLALATSCKLPSANNVLVPITSYLLFWNSTTGVATAQGSLPGDAGVRQLGTATPLSYGRYRIATTFPWTVSLPAEVGGGAAASSATCEVELYADATSLDDSTGEVTLCIP